MIKGSCDYLTWTSALDYRDTLPHARMAYLHDAGHRAYAEQPDEFLATVTAFLAGRPLPLPDYTGTAAPRTVKDSTTETGGDTRRSII